MENLAFATAKPDPIPKVPRAIVGGKLELVHLFRVTRESLDVVIDVPAHILVKQHEQTDELAVHILWLAVGIGHAAAADDDRSDQSTLDVFQFVDVGVVEPHNRAAIARSGTGSVPPFSCIDMGLAWRDGVVFLVCPGSTVVIKRAFGIFVIEHAVGMHAVGTAGVVFEDYANRVANFGAQDRAEQSVMLPLSRAMLEHGISFGG